MRISDREIEQILRLIAEGENLNLWDLEAFYRGWTIHMKHLDSIPFSNNGLTNTAVRL